MPTRRSGQLVLYTAALAAGAGLAFAVASAGADEPMSASITAKDPYSFDNGSGSKSVSIAAGGTVTFSYPSGMSLHNVVFDTAQPTSCTNMPAAASPAPWSGSCTFASYGTYAFHCSYHGSLMTGKIEVPDPNAETGPPAGQPAPPAVTVARRQQGAVVRGSVTTPSSPSKVAVTAFATKSALSVSRVRRIRIGSVSTHSTGTRKTSFALRINRTARRALRRRHRLPVSLRIVITPDGDYAVTKTATVVLRARS